ncbi:hypothetical protein [Sutterella megalosphaeroides]|uniref:hypothetical protein n=1 Tax=Sutterella megalosphaeroides TaxID=2494234 RepID=UPI000F4D414E|nr:hypothetical protein [Sutterella megalosphaeroides]
MASFVRIRHPKPAVVVSEKKSSDFVRSTLTTFVQLGIRVSTLSRVKTQKRKCRLRKSKLQKQLSEILKNDAGDDEKCETKNSISIGDDADFEKHTLGNTE